MSMVQSTQDVRAVSYTHLRIGRMPIAVPAGVTVDIAENNKVTFKGPKGTLERVLPAEMDIKLDGDTRCV